MPKTPSKVNGIFVSSRTAKLGETYYSTDRVLYRNLLEGELCSCGFCHIMKEWVLWHQMCSFDLLSAEMFLGAAPKKIKTKRKLPDICNRFLTVLGFFQSCLTFFSCINVSNVVINLVVPNQQSSNFS